jgi:hypothetical protein
MKDVPADFNGLTSYRTAVEQAFAAWNTAQQELVGFMTRRALACANWPTEIWNCRSPQDLVEQQTKFVQDLLADWHTSSARARPLFSDAIGAPGQLTPRTVLPTISSRMVATVSSGPASGQIHPRGRNHS